MNRINRGNSVIRTAGIRRNLKQDGFTLVEIMLATALFLTIMAIALAMFGQTSQIWQRSTEETRAFQSARIGFDIMTRNISQATMNTSLDYVQGSGTNYYFPASSMYDPKSPPTDYARNSALALMIGISGSGTFMDLPGVNHKLQNGAASVGVRFTGHALFFQFPGGYTTGATAGPGILTYSGMNKLLNTCGYYISYCADTNPINNPGVSAVFPSAPTAKYRYRLVQVLEPSESNQIYASYVGSGGTVANWISNALANQDNVKVIADNVIYLSFRCFDPTVSLTNQDPVFSSFAYNTRPVTGMANAATSSSPTQFVQMTNEYQLPPAVQIYMVAIDELSAKHDDTIPGISDETKSTVHNKVLTGASNGTMNYMVSSSNSINYADSNISTLERRLQAAKINYRVFTTIVPLRESKWTKQ